MSSSLLPYRLMNFATRFKASRPPLTASAPPTPFSGSQKSSYGSIIINTCFFILRSFSLVIKLFGNSFAFLRTKLLLKLHCLSIHRELKDARVLARSPVVRVIARADSCGYHHPACSERRLLFFHCDIELVFRRASLAATQPIACWFASVLAGAFESWDMIRVAWEFYRRTPIFH